MDIFLASAVVNFNDGALGVLNIMQKIGFHVGDFNISSSQQCDLTRVNKLNYKAAENTKKWRKIIHASKKGMIKPHMRIMV